MSHQLEKGTKHFLKGCENLFILKTISIRCVLGFWLPVSHLEFVINPTYWESWNKSMSLKLGEETCDLVNVVLAK